MKTFIILLITQLFLIIQTQNSYKNVIGTPPYWAQGVPSPPTSYNGYLQVGATSYLFFWYFPSLNSPSTDPLLLWLQGIINLLIVKEDQDVHQCWVK